MQTCPFSAIAKSPCQHISTPLFSSLHGFCTAAVSSQFGLVDAVGGSVIRVSLLYIAITPLLALLFAIPHHPTS